MGALSFLIAIATVLVAIFLYSSFSATKVDVPTSGWFGAGKPRKDDERITPFKVDVPQADLEDLKLRLSKSRVGHQALEDSDDFWYGFNAAYLEEIKNYWLNSFDWRKQEKIINSFEQFKTEIEGIKVHFIHSKPAAGYRTTVPLLMVHGWPGNVFEFYKIIPMLNDPKKHGIQSDVAFEVIAPSIPGYGWSEQPKKTGFSQMAAARVFKKLMNRLNFDRFYLQGGDWGSLVTSHIARMYPESVHALHLNMMFADTKGSMKAFLIDVMASFFPKVFLSSPALQEKHNFFGKFMTLIKESGYMHLQATKPDTVGTALNDSPIGLAAYILEKYSTWTNLDNRNLKDGGLTKKFTKDELLTMIMIYWTNGNIVSSQRFYRECFSDPINQELGKTYVSVPTAHASGLNEVFDRTPLEVSKNLYNVTHYTEIEDMGHFACFEEPKKIAVDIVSFVQSLL